MRRVMIPLIALALASFSSSAAAEQGSWQPRLSLYSGEFYDIAFASAMTVWAAGPGGVLLSEDGGASWRWTLNSPVNAVEAAGDGTHGWAVGPRRGNLRDERRRRVVDSAAVRHGRLSVCCRRIRFRARDRQGNRIPG